MKKKKIKKKSFIFSPLFSIVSLHFVFSLLELQVDSFPCMDFPTN